MKYDHPDDAVRAYARALDRSAMPSRSVVTHGREYERACLAPRCKKSRARARARARQARAEIPPDWFEDYSRDLGAIVQRCVYCQRLRTWVDAYILGGQGSGGKKGRPPSSMIRTGDIAPVSALIEQMSEENELGRTKATLYVRFVATGLSFDALAMEASEDPELGGAWSHTEVRRAVAQGRRWLERRLRDRGLSRAPTARPPGLQGVR